MSSALAGRFFTTEPQGSHEHILLWTLSALCSAIDVLKNIHITSLKSEKLGLQGFWIRDYKPVQLLSI